MAQKKGEVRAHLLVDGHVDAVELRKASEILSDEQTQLAPLLLPPRLVPHGALVLHPHPQLVHLGEVLKDERDRIVHVAASPTHIETEGKGKVSPLAMAP